MFVRMKKYRALLARVENIEKALSNGRVLVQIAQSNVTQPDGKGGFVSTLITEGPVSGKTSFKGTEFAIELNNPGGK